MDANAGRQRGMTLLAFAIIYFVWGSTFLAIRVGVAEMPPLVMAAMRFLAAGLAICAWLLARGERWPTLRQWLSASLLGFVMFVVDYGLLFWAETRVPSGLAAVVLATIPLFMALAEILFLRTQRLTPRLVSALLVGLAGVAVLMIRSLNLGSEPVDTLGAAALLTGSISWSNRLGPNAQASPAGVEGDERRRADAHRGSDVDHRCRIVWRVSRLSPRRSLI